jgi:Putative Ig domain
MNGNIAPWRKLIGLFTLGLVPVVVTSGCGGGSSSTPVSVTLSPSAAQAVDQGQQVTVGASVAHDSANKGVTWAVSGTGCSGSACGTITSTSTSATYTAPSSVSANMSVSLKATSVADTTKSAAVSITVSPAPSVTTTSLPAGTVGTAYSQTVKASGGAGTLTWALTSGSLPGGLSLSSGGTISGTASASGTSTFTVKVTDSGNPAMSATQQLSIVMNTAALAVSTSSLPNGVVGQAYPATSLSASGGVQPYTWSVTTGSLPAGLSLNSSGQISGTPTTVGTSSFTVQVTDSATPTASTATANLSITVTATAAASCSGYGSGNESVLNGNYAFLVQGVVGSGTLSGFGGAGSFHADGTGKITGGEADINAATGPNHLTVSASGSSYSVGSDNRGCALMAFGGSNTVVVHFAVAGISGGVASRGRVIEFDDVDGTGTRNAGILRLQTTTDFAVSSLNARYAFGLDGIDSTSAHVAIAGSVSVNTSNGNLSNGFADIDDGGSVASGITGATGSIGTISTITGRATGTFNGGAGATFNWAYYVVNKNEIFIVSTDAQSPTTPIASGKAIVTGSSFSASSLNGNYIVHVTGSQGAVADVTLGLLTIGSGAVNGTISTYGLGISPNAQTNTISGGTYAVDANSGRVTLTGTGNHSPILYLTTATDGVSGIFVGTDGSANFGYLELQPSANYTNAVSGNYVLGTEDPSDNTVVNEVGVVTVTGSTGATTGTADKSSGASPFLQPGQAVSGTITMNSSGVGTVGSSSSVALTNGTRLFYIDESTNKPAVIVVVEQ